MYSDRPLCEKSERLEVIKIDHIKIDLRVAGPDPPLKIAILLSIIGAVQFFKWHLQNYDVFAKILPRHSRGRTNFQVNL